MKLTMELLRDALRDRCDLTGSQLEGESLPLSRPIFYEAGMKAQPGQLYLSTFAAPELCRPGICAVYPEGVEPAAPRGSWLCLAEARHKVLNQIQKLYDRFDQWEAEMERIVLDRGTVQALLQISYPLVRNPILVSSRDFRVLAHCNNRKKGGLV